MTTARQRVRRPEPDIIPADDEHYGTGANLPAANEPGCTKSTEPERVVAPIITQSLKLPLSIKPDAPWIVLDAEGRQVIACGVDGDHERAGKEIALMIVTVANSAEDAKHLTDALRALRHTIGQKGISDPSAIRIAVNRLRGTSS